MSSSGETEELLNLISNEDDEALAEYFSRFEDKLLRMIGFRMDRRLLGRVDAHDVLQETWLDAKQRIHHYINDPAVPLFIWLRQITLQTLMNVHRRHLGTRMRDAAREVGMNHGGSQGTSNSMAAHFVGHLTSPSQAIMKQEMLARLEQALSEMNEVDREVLALRHFEELGNNEVAEILKLKPSAASNRYIRAMKRLKEFWNPCQDCSRARIDLTTSDNHDKMPINNLWACNTVQYGSVRKRLLHDDRTLAGSDSMPQNVTKPVDSAVRFDGRSFWVTHRRSEFGPFDYEWSKDFNGVEFFYRGDKFGEYCSSDEIYADLKEFQLPMRVVEVTTVVMGSMLFGVLNGLSINEKRLDLFDRLCDHGMIKFAAGIQNFIE